MKRLKEVLACAALLSVVALFGSLTAVLWMGWHARTEVGKAVSMRVDPVLKSALAATDAVTKTASGLPVKVGWAADIALSTVNGIADKADAQLTATRGLVADAVGRADSQMTAIQATVTAVASKADPLLSSYTKLGDEATATVKDARDSWDDSYDDVRSLLASAEVATTGIAKTSEAVAEAAPRVAQSVAGVAEDVHREADEFVKPKSTREKIAMWLSLIPKLAIKIL